MQQRFGEVHTDRKSGREARITKRHGRHEEGAMGDVKRRWCVWGLQRGVHPTDLAIQCRVPWSGARHTRALSIPLSGPAIPGPC